MEELMQVGIYTLIKTNNGNRSLNYYIDNKVDVSEYFDELEADRLMELEDEDFKRECKAYF